MMSVREIELPTGSLGIELEPSLVKDGCFFGIRVKSCEGHRLKDSNAVSDGTVFHSIDGVPTQTLAFKEAVMMLKNSCTRVVRVSSEAPPSKSVSTLPSIHEDQCDNDKENGDSQLPSQSQQHVPEGKSTTTTMR